MARNEMRSQQVIDMAVGALAASGATLHATRIDGSRLQGAIPRMVEYAIEYSGKTTLEGGLIYGLAPSNLTAGEISEWFFSDPQHDADDAELEESLRPVLILGYVPIIDTASDPFARQQVKRKKWPGWHIIEGLGLNFFMLNIDDASGVSTGMIVDGYLAILGDWID